MGSMITQLAARTHKQHEQGWMRHEEVAVLVGTCFMRANSLRLRDEDSKLSAIHPSEGQHVQVGRKQWYFFDPMSRP